MTSTVNDQSADRSTSTSRTPLLAAIGIGLSAVLTAIGTYAGENDTGDAARDDVSTWLFCVGIAVVAAGVLFGLVVRTAGRGNPGLRALVVGVVSVLTIPVFWAGVTTVAAAAAVACALVERDSRGTLSAKSKTALGLAALATAAAVNLAFVG